MMLTAVFTHWLFARPIKYNA